MKLIINIISLDKIPIIVSVAIETRQYITVITLKIITFGKKKFCLFLVANTLFLFLLGTTGKSMWLIKNNSTKHQIKEKQITPINLPTNKIFLLIQPNMILNTVSVKW